MEINVLIDDVPEECLEVGWLQRLVEQVLAVQGAGHRVELGLVITSQEKIRQLNRSYRGKDTPTDVLAFAMLPAEGEKEADFSPFVTPPDGIRHLGEVIISYPQAVIQAEEHQHSVNREIAILIIHGVLHLLGYEHDKPELRRQMVTREEEILNQINLDNG